MNYHNITHDDMNNGDGLRVVLWLSGCSHKCKNCQNPQTWNSNSGILFDEDAKNEIFNELSKDYISGITFSGGDPLHENNLMDVANLIFKVKENFPKKTIWLYAQYYDREYGINEVVEKIDKVINEVINEMVKEEILEVKKYGKYKNNRKSKHDKHSKKSGKISQSK